MSRNHTLTEEPVPPVREELAESLSAHLGQSVGATAIRSITDLSPGLSSSKVFRVAIRFSDGPHSFILKIPDWGRQSALRHADPMVQTREQLFLMSELPAALEPPLGVPAAIGVETRHARTWIWMEDVERAFQVRWAQRGAPLTAARAAAALHATWLRNRSVIERYDWLATEPYRLFEKHRGEARDNLARIASDPDLCPWLPSEWLTPIEHCLDAYEAVVRQLRQFPAGLIHGDYHPGNIGITANGRVLLIDWSQMGLGPLGSDLAIFISLYRLFGGVEGCRSARLEAQLMRAYCDELGALCPDTDTSYEDIERVVWLWAVSWGLHLRLGPGLSAVLGRRIRNPAALSSTIQDIYDGCERVVDKADHVLY